MLNRKQLVTSVLCTALAVSLFAPLVQADHVGGRRLEIGEVVGAYSSVRYSTNFYGGQAAEVIIWGDGDTDLDLFIYDGNGNLIASDTDSLDFCVCSWTPRWTGEFTVVVMNLGSVYNEFDIATN